MLAFLSLIFVHPVLADPSVVSVRQSLITIQTAAKIKQLGIRRFIEADLQRAAQLSNGVIDYGTNVPVTNNAVTYTANVGVGKPPTYYNLVVDTGSSNTWVGAGIPYVKTSTSIPTTEDVHVRYGSGNFTGKEFFDQVTLAEGLVIQKQSIGVANSTAGFQGYDGIIGLGPAGLTRGTLSPSINLSIPTVTDNLFSDGSIPTDQLGIFFQPTTNANATVSNGEITFGGPDTTKIKGDITYTPITTKYPASRFWGIDQSVTYDDKEILSTTAGIVDTGTTLVLFSHSAYEIYQKTTGATFDNTTGLLQLTSTQFKSLKSLYFNISGKKLELTANAQAWPRTLNHLIGGDSNSVYLIVGDLGNLTTPGGLDFINGYSFLQRYYSVYDTTNQRVGLAETEYTFAETN